MIKKIAVLLLASGNLMASDCSEFTYGSSIYASCLEHNQDRLDRQNAANQARLDNWANQINADDRARQNRAAIEDQGLIHPHAAMQMPKLGEDQ